MKRLLVVLFVCVMAVVGFGQKEQSLSDWKADVGNYSKEFKLIGSYGTESDSIKDVDASESHFTKLFRPYPYMGLTCYVDSLAAGSFSVFLLQSRTPEDTTTFAVVKEINFTKASTTSTDDVNAEGIWVGPMTDTAIIPAAACRLRIDGNTSCSNGYLRFVVNGSM